MFIYTCLYTYVYTYNIYIYMYIYIYIYIYICVCVILKSMCPLGYHHNGFATTHALGHMMYGYTLLVPMNQRVLNKHNISGHKWSTIHRIWWAYEHNIYVIIKTMCTPGYHFIYIHIFIYYI